MGEGKDRDRDREEEEEGREKGEEERAKNIIISRSLITDATLIDADSKTCLGSGDLLNP